jgi:predicted HicB family RNase H-like nuclease
MAAEYIPAEDIIAYTVSKVIEPYKGYYTSIHFVDNVYRGKILGIDDLVNHYGRTLDTFIKEFHRSVDDYLDFCDIKKKTPSKSKYPNSNFKRLDEITNAVKHSLPKEIWKSLLIPDYLDNNITDHPNNIIYKGKIVKHPDVETDEIAKIKLHQLITHEMFTGNDQAYNISIYDSIIPSYNSYHTSIYYNEKTNLFVGHVIGYKDLPNMNYEAPTIASLCLAFHNAVDLYIKPDKK